MQEPCQFTIPPRSPFFVPTAPGLPRWSPIQILTRPDPASLLRSDEIGHVQGGMAVDAFHILNIFHCGVFCTHCFFFCLNTFQHSPLPNSPTFALSFCLVYSFYSYMMSLLRSAFGRSAFEDAPIFYLLSNAWDIVTPSINTCLLYTSPSPRDTR